ncbi:MAG: alcohol dehydrogenase [Planctomycetota bacterium]|nr:MAG: alcohol dehydrogenase [Planctomycetota bacterium]
MLFKNEPCRGPRLFQVVPTLSANIIPFVGFLKQISFLIGILFLSNCSSIRTAFSNESSIPVNSQDWATWRGPHHNGTSDSSDWIRLFPESGPQIDWEAFVGTGFSSVSVVGDRLWTMGHKEGLDTVWCLDTATGKTVWTHTYPSELVDNLHEGGPGSTPTYDSGRIFTLGKEGHCFCLDAQTGKVLWNVMLPELTGVERPTWGFSGSALVQGTQVILDAGPLISLDINTGALLWKTKNYSPGYGSAVPFEKNGQHHIAALNNDALLVVQAIDGQVIAEFPWNSSFSTSSTTPVVDIADGDIRIWISTGYRRGGAMLRLTPDGLERIWENKLLSNHMASSIFWKGHLYGFDGNSHRARTVSIVCLDATTGDERWREMGFGCGSLMLADDTLIVLSDQGELLFAPASPEAFTPLSRGEALDGKCWSVPVLVRKRIYCRNADGRLVCVNVELKPSAASVAPTP